MVRSRDCYVPLWEKCASSLAEDGSSDVDLFYKMCLVRLMECVAEEKDKVRQTVG